MNFYNLLIEINFNKSPSEIGEIILPIAGVLLGLVYAAHIYWLQGGFSKLEYTRSILEDLLVAEGKIVLDLLIGASVISLFAIVEFVSWISVIFYALSITLIIDLGDYTAELGYVKTLFSSKSIPSNYGRVRSHIKKMQNAGLAGWIKPLVLFFFVICYPLILSFDSISSGILTLNNNSIIVFILSCTLISLLQVKSLLTQAFKVRKDVENRLPKTQSDKIDSPDHKTPSWNNNKRLLEKKVVLERLEAIGVISNFQTSDLMSKELRTSRDLSDKPILIGDPLINENGNCHLNLIIPYIEDDLKTREFIFSWTRKILELLAKSKTEVYKYRISFFRKENNLPKTHFALIRANKGTILKLMDKEISDEKFVMSFEGKYLAESIDDF